MKYEKFVKHFSWKLLITRQLGRSSRRCEGNIRTVCKYIRSKAVDLIRPEMLWACGRPFQIR
jgi:hypothetical protein